MKGSGTITLRYSILLLVSACGNGEASVKANVATPAVTGNASVGTAVASATPKVAASATADAPARDQSLLAFWVRFRRAALANDAVAIATMSAPVVIQHGTLDDSPKVRLLPRQVAPVLAKILDQDDGVDPQGRTQRQMMEAAFAPPKDRSAIASQYRFGDMQFTRGAGGWRLSALYFED